MVEKKTFKITVITLFPEIVELYTKFGIIARAIKNKVLKFKAVNLRDFSADLRGTVDGRPYGGGVGMVLRADVLYRAIQKSAKSKYQISNIKQKLNSKILNLKSRIILLTPQGKVFSQAHAKRLAKYDNLIFVVGRYEGFDERIRQIVDEEISIGDYILMGGELPALVVSEAVLRHVSGVLGKDESADTESFSRGLLEYPQYTKPETLRFKVQGSRFKELRVPKVLITGHHAKIEAWRKAESWKRTKKRRPDLLT